MSIDWFEAQQEVAYSAMMESLAEELYPEQKEQAIDEFIDERLKSYYLKNNEIAVNAVSFIKQAKESVNVDPTASLIYSSIATEVILKSVLLKPIVFGLVHTESLVELISEMLIKQNGLDRFKKLVFSILENHIEFDGGIEKYKRDGSSIGLWNERAEIQKTRNDVMHKAQKCSVEQAEASYSVSVVFFRLTELLINHIGFGFNVEYKITKLGSNTAKE
jgi:hypothetical protein